MDLRVGNGARVVALAVETYYLSLPLELVLELDNCYYVPAMSRNIISISCLDMVGFSFIIKNNTCSIYYYGIFCGDAHLSNGLYILNHDNPNAKSIYNINTKRFRSNDLNTTYLWHCHLGHINEKRISKLHQDGLLHSFDFESYEVSESCLLGKITKAPFTCHNKRVDDLLGLTHNDVCGPISSTAKGGYQYFISFTYDYSRYGYLYLMKHKDGSFEKFKHARMRYKINLVKVLKLFEHIEVVNA